MVARHVLRGEPSTIVRNAAPCTSLGGYPATRTSITVGDRALALFVVPDLERLVDRGALLRGEAQAPYWAYLWPGALALAEEVACAELAGCRVLEVGCGLGLPGLAAARAGADVDFLDLAAPALPFVEASLEANGLAGRLRHADFRTLDPDERFDVILAAEVVYDREGFRDLAALFRGHLVPGGVGLLTDGYRTDTRPFYRELGQAGLATAAIDGRVQEEGRSHPLRVLRIETAPEPSSGSASSRRRPS
jgi:predicted nicotinamide N-methyase